MADEAELAKSLSAELDKRFEELIWGGPGKKEAAQAAWAESVYPPPRPKRPEYPKLAAHVVNGKIVYVFEHGMFNYDVSS